MKLKIKCMFDELKKSCYKEDITKEINFSELEFPGTNGNEILALPGADRIIEHLGSRFFVLLSVTPMAVADVIVKEEVICVFQREVYTKKMRSAE
jgi:hypothetical protein